jgi:hypothetical protein
VPELPEEAVDPPVLHRPWLQNRKSPAMNKSQDTQTKRRPERKQEGEAEKIIQKKKCLR